MIFLKRMRWMEGPREDPNSYFLSLRFTNGEDGMIFLYRDDNVNYCIR